MGDKYSVVELGTLSGGEFSEAFGINDSNQIVGRAARLIGGPVACLWQPVSGYDAFGLGTAWNAPAQPLELTSSATAINSDGKVVGWTQKGDESKRHALLFDAAATDLSAAVGKAWSQAMDINDQNVFVGISADGPLGVGHAFVCDLESGIATTIIGSGTAKAINNSGQVAGVFVDKSYGGWQAFVYQNGQLSFIDPGPGNVANAVDINNHGQVVGEFKFKPFIYNIVGQILTTLNVAGMGIGTAINDVGQVVGITTQNGVNTAWLYTGEEDGVVPLNDLIPSDIGWNFSEAHDINSKGKIVGIGQLHGKTRGFLLAPLDKPTKPVRRLSSEVAIDPMSLVLSGKAYEVWVELHHPHEPKEKIQEMLRALSPSHLTFVVNRAASLLEYGKAIEARGDRHPVRGVSLVEGLLGSMEPTKRESILNLATAVVESGELVQKEKSINT